MNDFDTPASSHSPTPPPPPPVPPAPQFAGDVDHRFAYHPPRDEATVKAHERVRGYLGQLAQEFEATLPTGREKALTITKLEEAMFWANAAIARAGAEA